MEEAWDRAATAAAGGEAAPLTLTLDGAVKCPNGRLPASSLDRFPNLEHLSIASIRLASLEGFPRLPSLRRLILSDNRIAGGLEALPAAGLDALRDLDLSNNRIGSLEELEPLAKLGLVSLDLYECPVTKIKGYREQVFGLIKTLKYLDKMDREGNERPESDDDEDDEEDDDDEEEGEEEEEEEVAVNGKGGGEEDDEDDEDSEEEEVDDDGEDVEDGEEGEGEDEEERSGEEKSVQQQDEMESPLSSSKKRKKGEDDKLNGDDNELSRPSKQR